MKLTLKIIEQFGMKKVVNQTDYDDFGYDFKLPNGITLYTMYICSGEPTESDSLEGLDGWIFITTLKELVELYNSTYEEVIEKIALENEKFDKTDYI